MPLACLLVIAFPHRMSQSVHRVDVNNASCLMLSGAPPVIVGKIKDKEIGGVNVIEVERDSEAPPNLGSVFIDGESSEGNACLDIRGKV